MPTIFILGNGSEGMLGKKITTLLKNKARIIRDTARIFKKPDFIFYIEKDENKEEFAKSLGLTKNGRARFLYVFPKNQIISKETQDLEKNINISFVKTPSILFQEKDLIENKEQLAGYIDSCANKILEIMFGSQNKGGLFFLPEPPFTASVIEDKKDKDKKLVKKTLDKYWQFLSIKRIFLLALTIFLIPIFTTIFFGLLGSLGLYLFQNSFLVGDINRSQFFSRVSVPSFSIAEKSGNILAFELAIIGVREQASFVKSVLSVGVDLAEGSHHLAIGTNLFKDHLTNLLKNKKTSGQVFTKTKREFFTKAKAELLLTKEKLDSAQITLANLNNEQLRSLGIEIPRVTNYESIIDKSIIILEAAPQIMGINEKKTYLVLLQNNMELRPTGGFIGSFGLLSFDNGRLLGFEIYDVYDADGQLKGHVDPPLPIRKYLEQPNWFLRDSNWNPDFPGSAKQAVWFLDKEMKKRVDGVIAIDVSSAEFLVEAMGSVYLPDYEEKITKDNLLERAHYYSQKDFFPRSKSKKDFLGALARAIFEKLENDEKLPLARIFNSLLLATEEKHIMFYFEDPAVNKLFQLNNLTGSISHAWSEKENTLNDLFMLVDANLGVNKINYFVGRDINYLVSINEVGGIDILAKIVYTNKSQKDNYKNYLRIVSPAGSKIKKVEFNDQELKELDIEESVDKTVFGFLATVPARSQKEVLVTYTLKKSILSSKGLNIYNLKILKQPGTVADSLTIKINYPSFLLIKNINTQEARIINTPKSLSISSDLRRDREFEVKFLNK